VDKIWACLYRLPKSFSDSVDLDSVIPANAGIQAIQYFLDPGFRRGDG